MTRPEDRNTPPMNVHSLQEALEDQAIDQLVQLQSGSATEADFAAFSDWRQQSPAHEAAAREAEALWQDIGHTHTAHRYQLEQLNTQEAADDTPESRPTPAGKKRWLVLPLAASLCALAVSLQYFPLATVYADYSTGTGEQQQVELADGSRILLNSATALSVELQADARHITLHSGEALFDVQRDSARPFIVHSAGSETRVLGTQFSVHQQAETRVTVQEGRVELRAHAGADQVRTLTANQQASTDGQHLSPVSTVDSQQLLAWQRGRLIVSQQPLAAVVEQLQRYLPGRVLITDPQLAQQPVSGIFDLTRPDQLLDTLQQSLDLQLIRLPLLTLVRPQP